MKYCTSLSLCCFYYLHFIGEEDKKEKVHFSSSRVCKSFLLSCCPHDILAHTVSNAK